MIREAKSIRAAAQDLNLAFTNEELVALENRKGFQQVLRGERHKFYKELATDPERGKLSIIGQMIQNIQRLQEEGQSEKVLEGLLKLAKVEGIVGADQTVNVFGVATPKDLENAKKAIFDRIAGQSTGITQEAGTA